MSVLGAQLEDLTNLAGELGRTEGEIGNVQGQSQTETGNVVGDVTRAANTALTRISTLMDELRAAVDASARNADSASWTGANRETFVGAYSDFNAAMVSAENATKETFQNFDTTIQTMSGQLEEYQTSLTTALGEAQTSTNSMARAVESQRDNLDQVMNTGMNVA